jgi:hypothetical protein
MNASMLTRFVVESLTTRMLCVPVADYALDATITPRTVHDLARL